MQHAQRFRPEVAFVFGSGLGEIAARIRAASRLPFADLPELAATSVAGHDGQVILGEWAGRRVLAFSGRLHRYEGHAWDRVLALAQLAAAWGVRSVIFTNAAGGIRNDLAPGTLMAVTSCIDLTRGYPWIDGPSRPPARLYSQRLVGLLAQSAKMRGIELAQGSYAAVLGPNYETPAEIRALRALGVDAVGMSTACESEAAARLGLECAAISCITNRAAGLSPHRLSHEEVLLNSRRQAGRLADLLEHFLRLEPLAPFSFDGFLPPRHVPLATVRLDANGTGNEAVKSRPGIGPSSRAVPGE